MVTPAERFNQRRSAGQPKSVFPRGIPSFNPFVRENTDTDTGGEGINLDLVSEARRAKIRAYVEGQGPVIQFLMEAAPATLGTFVGSLGGLPGAIVGGTAGEAIGQDVGISPRSDISLGLSAAGPFAGKAIGKVIKTGKFSVGKAITVVGPSKLALSKASMRKAVDEMEQMGMKILGKQKGFMQFEASTLYRKAEAAGVRIPTFRTTETRAAITSLRKELLKLKPIRKVREALALFDESEAIMKGSSVTVGDLITLRAMVGRSMDAAGRVAKKSGIIKGAKKKFFKAVASDMDHLASLGGKTGIAGKLAKAATQRARLNFAIDDFDKGVAQFTSELEGKSATVLNVKGFRKWLFDRTNPKSKSYNRDMATALESDLPLIRESLERLSKFGQPGSAGGVGSLIIRGKGAAMGAAIGSVFGRAGSIIGTAVGVSTPEIATAILSSPRAISFLEKAAGFGRKPLTRSMWEVAGQIAAQGAKVNEFERNDELP